MSKRTSKSSTVGIGIVIGTSIGVLIGSLFTDSVDLAWALIIGSGLGVVIAAVVDARRRVGNKDGGGVGDE
jgi:MFS family permease